MVAPNPYQIIISPRARGELFTLFGTTSLSSSGPVSDFYVRLAKSISTLDIFPHRTVWKQARGGRREAVRTVAVKPFVVYLRVIEAERKVEIMSIRHGARRRPRGL